ncbi:hypothetical protein BOC39_03340 [Burkholderia pseudomallei]|nr:hypothetical protein BOC36_31160 [Burkholderia pseudomallei]ARK69496.1 hypothetical protein BOC38_22530 [Burkholderia pseudomallei]ARK72803.1 hypothetical protein BOC39_03340 [Burkholderia pseudomallei]ARL90277.1 hypothetical protein BOC57_30525 [Burkholderia pseudomallei]
MRNRGKPTHAAPNPPHAPPDGASPGRQHRPARSCGPGAREGQAQRSCKAATRHPRAEPSGESETTAAHTRIQFLFRRIFATQISDNPEKAAKLTSAFIIGQRFRF